MHAPVLLSARQVERLVGDLDLRRVLRRVFRALEANQAVQPPQTLTLLPNGAGDFITYLGAIAADKVFGAKLSPYLAKEGRVTAWTLLMCMETGEPLLLCDAGRLTAERTAATTALAVDLLAPAGAKRLAVIGAGPIGEAHIRQCLPVRRWRDVRVFARSLAQAPARRAALAALDPKICVERELGAAVMDADVILLCTSSAVPVLDVSTLNKPVLITSVSSNAPLAHEVPPEALHRMDVYCDYRRTTPGTAGEMVIAAMRHGWLHTQVVADLPELVAERAVIPDYERHVFFRSIGLGLEDVAAANAIRQAMQGPAGGYEKPAAGHPGSP